MVFTEFYKYNEFGSGRPIGLTPGISHAGFTKRLDADGFCAWWANS